MDFLKQRQKTRQKLTSKITILCLFILLFTLIQPTWKIFEKSRESRKNLKQAETELVSLETSKQKLARDIAYLNTDHGRDQEIRNKFALAREGETMVVIVRNGKGTKPVEPPLPQTFFQKTWSSFLQFFGLQ